MNKPIKHITEVQNIHTRDLLKFLLGVVSSSLDGSFVLIHHHTWHNPFRPTIVSSVPVSRIFLENKPSLLQTETTNLPYLRYETRRRTSETLREILLERLLSYLITAGTTSSSLYSSLYTSLV